jgi:hypothetical protein
MSKKFYILAKGGYLKEPIVDEIELKEEEMMEEEFDDFEDYALYTIDEARSTYEQMMASTIVLSEAEMKAIVEAYKG